MEGRVFCARITDQMFKIEVRMEDVVHAGKAEAPFVGVDFLSRRGKEDGHCFARSQEDVISRVNYLFIISHDEIM